MKFFLLSIPFLKNVIANKNFPVSAIAFLLTWPPQVLDTCLNVSFKKLFYDLTVLTEVFHSLGTQFSLKRNNVWEQSSPLSFVPKVCNSFN